MIIRPIMLTVAWQLAWFAWYLAWHAVTISSSFFHSEGLAPRWQLAWQAYQRGFLVAFWAQFSRSRFSQTRFLQTRFWHGRTYTRGVKWPCVGRFRRYCFRFGFKLRLIWIFDLSSLAKFYSAKLSTKFSTKFSAKFLAKFLAKLSGKFSTKFSPKFSDTLASKLFFRHGRVWASFDNSKKEMIFCYKKLPCLDV